MSTWWTALKDLALIAGAAVWLAGFSMCLIGFLLDPKRPRRLTIGAWALVAGWHLAYPILFPVQLLRSVIAERGRKDSWKDLLDAIKTSRQGPPACEQPEPELETVEEKE